MNALTPATSAAEGLPDTVFTGLLDDAAVFPPGNATVPEAVDAHRRHGSAPYRGLVGPLVVPAAALDELAREAGDGPPFGVVVTLPGPAQIPEVLEAAPRLPVRVTALEVAVPGDVPVSSLIAAIERGVGDRAVSVAIEVPRDDRREPLLAALAGRYRAKFRTGGVLAGLYPSEDELAGSVLRAIGAGVPFKATAGLHHAVRNTDPSTGFEQHGFLNVLLATAVAAGGAGLADVRAALAERNGAALADQLRGLGNRARAARAWFTSFGTCSITEPVAELTALGLLASPAAAPGVRP